MADIERNMTISRFLRRATEFVWPFGAFQKTKEPHKAIENLERASGAATLWILGGILLDIAALWWFPHNQQERVVGIVANAAIGFGLVVEYLVVGRVIDATKEAERESNERIAKIEEHTAKANERGAEAMARAEEAELARIELERDLAPRTLSDEQVEVIAKKLAEFAGTRVDMIIDARNATPDTRHIAGRLTFTFLQANLRLKAFEIGSGLPSLPEITVTCNVGHGCRPFILLRNAIVDALKDAGLQASRHAPMNPSDPPPGTFTYGARSGWVAADVASVRVTVSTKLTKSNPNSEMIIYET